MKQALIQRIILGVILIIAVMVLNFFLLQAAPGDVVDAMLAEAGGGDPELAARLRKQYGVGSTSIHSTCKIFRAGF